MAATDDTPPSRGAGPEQRELLMGTSGNAKYGLDSMLTPENCVLLLIDHQPMQFSSIGNIQTALLLSNVIALAKTAKAFGVPTIITTVLQDRGGFLPKELQDVFSEQKPISRRSRWPRASPIKPT